jgi:hypothetical protein
MMIESEPRVAALQINSEDQAVLGTKLLQTMQQSIYANRMRVAPRRIKELVQEEIVLLQEFLVADDKDRVRERGKHLAREGLGPQAMINLSSTLRLSCWEIARHQQNVSEVVAAIEDYTVALLDGFLTMYEQELCREQQRTHEAFVRSLSS